MLLEDRLPVGSLGVLYGAPKVGKSFITLDWCIRLARSNISVLYLAGEGISGYGARARAWNQHYGPLDPDEAMGIPFWLGERMINFTPAGNSAVFVQEIVREMATEAMAGADEDTEGELVTMPGTVDLVVVDTLSRALPGVDENDQGEMSKAIEQIDYFRKLTGSTVLFLHHTTKADRKRWRGSSVIEGAADVMMLAYEEKGDIIVKVEAAREFDASDKEWRYKLQPVGDSAVVVESQTKAGEQESLGGAKQAVYDALLLGNRNITSIAIATAMKYDHVAVVLSRLLEAGLIEKQGRGVYAPIGQGLDKGEGTV